MAGNEDWETQVAIALAAAQSDSDFNVDEDAIATQQEIEARMAAVDIGGDMPDLLEVRGVGIEHYGDTHQTSDQYSQGDTTRFARPELNETMTVGQLKAQLHEAFGIEASKQRIFIGPVELADDNTQLKEYGIIPMENEYVLRLDTDIKDETEPAAVPVSISSSSSSSDEWYTKRGVSGLAGLRNQGATCYLNSLLQLLYLTPEFRSMIFAASPQDHDSVTDIIYQLQLLFGRLQCADVRSVSTLGLTKSFGWDDKDTFQQHDVQEMFVVLCDNLEKLLADTPHSRTISDLYRGAWQNRVLCTACGSVSANDEYYYDIVLPIKGKRNIMESFDELTETEILDGDNAYYCSKCNAKQKAEKSTKLLSLPRVLNVVLTRFDFDWDQEIRIKLNDKVAYPMYMQLNKYLSNQDCIDEGRVVESHGDKGLSVIGVNGPVYELSAILMHSGTAGCGHFFAFIKHPWKHEWYEFNDESVTQVMDEDIWGVCSGTTPRSLVPQPRSTAGVYDSPTGKDYTSAYMLAYRRRDPDTLNPVTDDDVDMRGVGADLTPLPGSDIYETRQRGERLATNTWANPWPTGPRVLTSAINAASSSSSDDPDYVPSLDPDYTDPDVTTWTDTHLTTQLNDEKPLDTEEKEECEVDLYRFCHYQADLPAIEDTSIPTTVLSQLENEEKKRREHQQKWDKMQNEITVTALRCRAYLEPITLKVDRRLPLTSLMPVIEERNKEEVAKKLVADAPPLFRFRRAINRENDTRRPSKLYTDEDYTKNLYQLNLHQKHYFYLEQNNVGMPMPSPESLNEIFLTIKWWSNDYDSPVSLCDIVMARSATVWDLKMSLCASTDIDCEPQDLVIVEEETEAIINLMFEDDLTLKEYELITGDVLHVERVTAYNLRGGDGPDASEIVRSRVDALFRESLDALQLSIQEVPSSYKMRLASVIDNDDEDKPVVKRIMLRIDTSKSQTLGHLKGLVGEHLKVDPNILRLTIPDVFCSRILQGSERLLGEVLLDNRRTIETKVSLTVLDHTEVLDKDDMVIPFRYFSADGTYVTSDEIVAHPCDSIGDMRRNLAEQLALDVRAIVITEWFSDYFYRLFMHDRILVSAAGIRLGDVLRIDVIDDPSSIQLHKGLKELSNDQVKAMTTEQPIPHLALQLVVFLSWEYGHYLRTLKHTVPFLIYVPINASRFELSNIVSKALDIPYESLNIACAATFPISHESLVLVEEEGEGKGEDKDDHVIVEYGLHNMDVIVAEDMRQRQQQKMVTRSNSQEGVKKD